MQRSLYKQAVRMHGQDLTVLIEKNQHENYVFIEDENEEQKEERAAENDQREPIANAPDPAPPMVRPDGVRLTGTMRDLLHPRVSIDSSTEDSSKSDTSPEILPLGVPRELHEPFEEISESMQNTRKGQIDQRYTQIGYTWTFEVEEKNGIVIHLICSFKFF